ncbi:MAG: hypothetical protein IIB38_08110 [Candidatus Hydrogenedentes bacterium]|nr:hypothetical protein [Candidatus Hydrogenedentota bacterium]
MMRNKTCLAIGLSLVLVLILTGCVTGPLTPEAREARADAAMRIVNRTIADVFDITGDNDGAIQLWITDDPARARTVLNTLASGIDLAMIAGAKESALRIARNQLDRFVALFENTTGEPFDLLEPL